MIAKAAKISPEHSISELCKIARVSRSGYYSWLKRPIKEETLDELLVVDLFEMKKRKYGIRRLKMFLERHTGTIFNLKKIRRIKKKYNLVTKVRKVSKYRAIFKIGEEHKVSPNLLQRNFTPDKNEILVSTDITELPFLGGQKAYLSAFKDLRSKKIIHYNLGLRPTIELATIGLNELFSKMDEQTRSRMIIHSDQGFHYTSYAYRSKLAHFGITQSMSRKGNCLDNAPIESFFGHLKDESEYRMSRNFKELKKEIDGYISYYNNERPQWGLERKTPAEAGVNFSLVF